MNYKQYKHIMKERGLIETPITVEYLEDAKILHYNMKVIKGYNSFDREVMAFFDIDILELLKTLSEEKNEAIQRAIDEAWDEKETIELFGRKYYSMIKVMEKVVESKIAPMKEHYERHFKIRG